MTSAIDNVHALIKGINVADALSLIESAIFEALNGFNVETSTQNVQNDDSDEVFDGIDFDGCDNDDPFEDDTFYSSVDSNVLRRKLRRDLRAVKNAGFKVGYLGHIDGCITLSVASRIARLGISEETMKAWNVCSSEYLVLLIRYNHTYQTLQDLFNLGDLANSQVQMRIGLCDSYKPSLKAATQAFQSNDSSASNQESQNPLFRGVFIGLQLDKLLNERFLGIVKIRLLYGLSWTGAEHLFHAGQGKQLAPEDASAPEYLEPDDWATPPPAYLLSDHLADTGLVVANISMPLSVLQFTLRHFVRCTEFCLVCHCKKDDNYETLKPYVCSNGLCLYQYINFGMGPSLEYEIILQPYVVDLLVSLAYARAKAGLLEDFPTGLGLQVPDEIGPEDYYKATALTWTPSSDAATFDPARLELYSQDLGKLKTGDWLAFKRFNPKEQDKYFIWHARIQEIGENRKHLVISYPIDEGGKQLSVKDIKAAFQEQLDPVNVRYAVYDKNLDGLGPEKKRKAIVKLLNTLPQIEAMAQYLKLHGSSAQLSSWRDRISPAALDLLRWIVASNRSCILQDRDDPEHLVNEMRHYIQFRLVQGAPDKEQRFLRAIDQHATAKKSQYPTLFAWHGSPIQNWHSILREGLHYKEIRNGRACGDGVYMSNCFATSNGYCSKYSANPYQDWPQSMLKIRSVISLNEVVNATNQFVCVSPHYVVDQLDWIQPRYLFVGTPSDGQASSNFNSNQSVDSTSVSSPKTHVSASVIYKQDPSHPVHGPDGQPIKIPISVFSSKRRSFLSSSKTPSKTRMDNTEGKKGQKKKKGTKKDRPPESSQSSSSKGEDDELANFEGDEVASIMTTVEDLNILLSDSDDEVIPFSFKKYNSGKDTADGPPKTDFVPGTLKEGSLPLLSPPQYATSIATKLLQKHLRTTLKVQDQEPLHELGWFVDPALIKTVYQWIVELHTFDPNLPLAQDLKKAKLQSVVLELRFPPEFPMDPPFVRVIRPRFLAFREGGGGHITFGGALCMELLTNSGWSAVTSIDSLLLQVRLAICSTDPQPGRLASYGSNQDYGIGEAVEYYKRACNMHGWKIPKDMERISW